jgi:ATP-binding cassette, subfamily B (MDR/TAP), member 1
MVLFTTTAAEIAFNIRVKYVDVVLKQDVATVDKINSDTVGGAGQAINDIEKIEIGLGEQFGMAIQLTSVIVSAFIISLVRYGFLTTYSTYSSNVIFRQWKLGLVVSTMIPITIITVGITVAIDIRLEKKIQQIFELTSNVAKDALTNIRDILALTAEADIFSQYDKLLEKAMKLGFTIFI